MDSRQLEGEFRSAAAAVVATKDDPDLAGLRVARIEAGPDALILFEGAPILQVANADVATPVDTAPIVQALAWTLGRRARRIATGETYGDGDGRWSEALKARFPSWFRCEVSPEPGWADLVFAMAERIEAIGAGPSFAFTQVKSKFGTLRAYNQGFTDPVSELVDAFEAASAGICETCGAPGILRRTQGYWYLTACEEHSRGGMPLRDVAR